jgi:hypothetical protein
VVNPVSHRDDTLKQVLIETLQPKHGQGYLHKIQPQSQVPTQETDALGTLVSSKEQINAALAVQLRAERKISALGVPFEELTEYEILAYMPLQTRYRYYERTVIQVIKPLYRIVKAGTYWWVTYHNHYLKKLQMITSTLSMTESS